MQHNECIALNYYLIQNLIMVQSITYGGGSNTYICLARFCLGKINANVAELSSSKANCACSLVTSSLSVVYTCFSVLYNSSSTSCNTLTRITNNIYLKCIYFTRKVCSVLLLSYIISW